MIIRWIKDRQLEKCKDKAYAAFVDHTQKVIYRVYKEHLKEHPELNETMGNSSMIHANYFDRNKRDGMESSRKIHIDIMYGMFKKSLEAVLESEDEELLSVLNMALEKNREYESVFDE